ncbi:MAG: four helix bundle protein [Hyphomonadaceae bacterium]
MGASSYRDLEVWAKAMDVAQAVYAAAELMPKKEEYRLTAQMIRAAVSIPANIAEGHARATRRDYAHFVSIARGSTAELETLLLLASRAKHLSETVTQPLLEEAERVARMLNRLHARLKDG